MQKILVKIKKFLFWTMWQHLEGKIAYRAAYLCIYYNTITNYILNIYELNNVGHESSV